LSPPPSAGRPLSREKLARLRDALEPDATAVSARPLAGGVDTATYALRLARGGSAREVVVRVYRDWEGDAAAAAQPEFENAVARLHRFA